MCLILKLRVQTFFFFYLITRWFGSSSYCKPSDCIKEMTVSSQRDGTGHRSVAGSAFTRTACFNSSPDQWRWGLFLNHDHITYFKNTFALYSEENIYRQCQVMSAQTNSLLRTQLHIRTKWQFLYVEPIVHLWPLHTCGKTRGKGV